MALLWDWKDKVGTMTLVQKLATGEDQEFELNLYQGNAFLIMIHEYEADGKDMYTMYSFFTGKDHMKNCLGLNKKDGFGDNFLNEPNNRATKFRINKKKYRYTKDLVTALIQAFDNIDIEIYSEEDE